MNKFGTVHYNLVFSLLLFILHSFSLITKHFILLFEGFRCDASKIGDEFGCDDLLTKYCF